ncbi:MAG: phosphodiester glycosidase family protein [Bacteroidaceae bacterium]|nr:phosphodiester glycosidase family protein [Bacteroidaceae bacterium]
MNNNQPSHQRPTPEVAIITIERDEEQASTPIISNRPKRRHPLLWITAIALLFLGIGAALYAYKSWHFYHNLGVTISCTPAQNIEKLKATPAPREPQIVMTTDSILGVGLNIYTLHGVAGTIEFQEPDTADASVYLYCRSADFKADGSYIGSLIAQGKELANSNKRLGYMAMANGNNVVGIARSEEVKDYVAKQNGSFFRQFILVSNGELPPRFYLHGKVERCAMGRIDNQIYYITSRNRETMWSFADALREYGFTDAIYITGGKDYAFYRDKEGKRHDIHNPADYPHKKWAGIIPWLVFRKSK